MFKTQSILNHSLFHLERNSEQWSGDCMATPWPRRQGSWGAREASSNPLLPPRRGAGGQGGSCGVASWNSNSMISDHDNPRQRRDEESKARTLVAPLKNRKEMVRLGSNRVKKPTVLSCSQAVSPGIISALRKRKNWSF